ncbi:MAG: efflux RND transporter periplasmic adaptor subunit [Phycisphaerales bacterium]
MWKWLLGFFVVVLLGLAGAGYYLQSSGTLKKWTDQFNPQAQGVKVKLWRVSQGDLVRTVSAPGTIEPKTKVEVSSQVSARIIGLPFREGQTVKDGDVVVRLDARDLAALLDSAKAQLKSEEARLEGARAALANASIEFNRRKELFATKDIPKTELDNAEAEYLRADSNFKAQQYAIEIARANITRAEKDLDNTVIKAPFDGIITRLDAEVGETVVVGTLNNPGSVIMEIADLGLMLLKARVDEANVAPVKEGQKAKVYVNAFPDASFIGTIDHVGLKKKTDRDNTSYFETDIILELPEGVLLRDGMTANAEVQVETFRDVVKVPSQAVIDYAIDELPTSVANDPRVDRSKKFARVVFVVESGKARVVPVTTGPSDLADTIISGGLALDATIVIGPFKTLAKLKHEQTVTDESAAKTDTKKAEIENAADSKERPKG